MMLKKYCPPFLLLFMLAFILNHAGFSSAQISQNQLSEVKVGVVYERLNDNRPKRTLTEHIEILKATHADLIFRASWRWKPCLNSCSELSTPELQQECELTGYTHESMQNTIQEIKGAVPDILIVGAIPAQRINQAGELNEFTGTTYNAVQVWDMAVDPAKWDITKISKEDFQTGVANSGFSGTDGYYPDITNPVYQEILLSWAKKQIDSGMDAIWVDLLYTQAGLLATITEDEEHDAVRESFKAASDMVDKIHQYGESVGKYIYVGTWSSCMNYPYVMPKLDFVTVTPTSMEIVNRNFNENQWTDTKTKISNAFGEIPIFAFIDWAGDGAPISVFSQELDQAGQREVLEKADVFFTAKGMTFVYPVHGGSLGESATKLAYMGIYDYGWYDAQAPEFDTYGKICELAQNKVPPEVSIITPQAGAKVFGLVSIEAAATDNLGVSKVEFYIDGLLSFTDTASPYQWLWPSRGSSWGEHKIKVIAYDTNDNFSEQEITVQIIDAVVSGVYPNPYIKGESPEDKIRFINLPQEAVLRIFTMSGELIQTIKHKAPADGGSEEWDLSGIAGGIYIYTIDSFQGLKKGKLSVIK